MARDNLAEEWPPLRTITDLALRFWNVRLRCRRCRHERVLLGASMWWLFHRRHWSDHVSEAPRRFYCSRCLIESRHKVRPNLTKTKDAPTGAPFPEPSDVDWKRLVARYRS